jgi:hypothetical protein
VELIFLDRAPDGDYLVFYTKAKNLAQAHQAFETSTSHLDLETKKVIADTWDTSSIWRLDLVAESEWM